MSAQRQSNQVQLAIERLRPSHALSLAPQESQRVQLGLAASFDQDDAVRLAEAPGEAWAAVAGGRTIAVFGLVEAFRHVQATAWAVLSGELGAHHVAITRFCAARIAGSAYRRIEAIVECADAEAVLARFPGLDQGELLAALSAARMRTAGVRWALAVGLKPAAVLRAYGAASETHMLLERIG